MKFTSMIIIAILSAIAMSAGAMEKENGNAAGAGFTTSTTHIEADVWSLLKIERPEPDRPRAAKHDDKAAGINLNWFGILKLDKHLDERERPRAMHLGFVEAPFFQAWRVNRDGAFVWDDEVINWYWFALFDGMVEKDYEKQNAEGGNSTYARLAVLDAPMIFTGYRLKFEAPQRTYWEALDLPLSTTVSHLTDKDRETWKVLNLPLGVVYYHDQQSTSSETTLMDLALGYLYAHEWKDAGEGEPPREDWEFMQVPFLALAAGDRYGETKKTTVLEGLRIYDENVLFLWRKQVDGEKVASTQALKLPFVGPVYASWTDGAGRHAGLFPKLFSRSYPKSLKTIF